MKIGRFMYRGLNILIASLLLFLCFASTFSIKAYALDIYLNEYYYIASAMDTNKVLDVSGGSHRDGTNIQLHQKNGTDAQLFKIIRSSDGYFSIINKGSGKALDVQGGGTASRTNVQLYRQNNTQAQQWQFYYAYGSNENVSIRARCGKFLDVSGGSTQNGTNIWIYDGNNSMAQAFKLVPYINTTYQTVTLSFYDLNSWMQQMELAQRNATFGGKNVTNPSGNTYYNGKIITGMTVLEWKPINVRIPLAGPGNPYRTETVNLPSKIRFSLHSHDTNVKAWFTVSNLNFWQQCECGYRDEWTWAVPLPDYMTEWTDAQTTGSVIRSIAPNHRVLYTVQ